MTDPRRTEQVHPDYADLDTLAPDALIAALADDQLGAVRAVQAAAPQLTAALNAAVPQLERGGRLVYVGRGNERAAGRARRHRTHPHLFLAT